MASQEARWVLPGSWRERRNFKNFKNPAQHWTHELTNRQIGLKPLPFRPDQGIGFPDISLKIPCSLQRRPTNKSSGMSAI
jgi:hypothetical protein